MRTRLRLMEFNRAVCLECPEFQVPWFHERYCQQSQKTGANEAFCWCIMIENLDFIKHVNCRRKYFLGSGVSSPAQQQIHKILAEVLGGINCVRGAVATPYFYTIGEWYFIRCFFFEVSSLYIAKLHCHNQVLDRFGGCPLHLSHLKNMFYLLFTWESILYQPRKFFF